MSKAARKAKRQPAHGSYSENRDVIHIESARDRRVSRSQLHRAGQMNHDHSMPIREERDSSPVRPRNAKQAAYLQSLSENRVTVGYGPAGTGKTYIATKFAAQQLVEDPYHRLYLCRPAVEAEENLGFLPGDAYEKIRPFFEPYFDVLELHLGVSHVEYLLKAKRIQMRPFAHMRGTTFRNATILLDEAQNTTEGQMKMFLTRIGQGSRIIIDGDVTQKDIKKASGLTDLCKRMKGITGFNFVQFEEKDCVRDPLVKEILARYNDE